MWSDYYAFDDAAREVRFLRHDMPQPWMNYLSNGDFHVMISQAGGGMVWYKSPQIWRITRYRFYNLPMDRPGPYVYLRDVEDGSSWSLSAEPCLVRPDEWSSAHGLGYTRFNGKRRGIDASVTYFVPPGVDALVWRVNIRNESDRARHVDVFAYVEFSLMEFLREVQWQCYVKHQLTVKHDGAFDGLVYHYGANMQLKPSQTPDVYFAADCPLTGWDGNRDVFIGAYRSEEQPLGLETGCGNSELAGGDACGALQKTIDIAPGEEREIVFYLGVARNPDEAAVQVASLRQPGAIDEHWRALGESWDRKLNVFNASVPDSDVARQVNWWNPYQVERNFLFSRSISYYAAGFRGVGFRDTAQDIVAMTSLDSAASRDKIRVLLAEQWQDGHCNHTAYPVEGFPSDLRKFSDDHLWPILTVWQWIAETGDAGILSDKIPYYDGGEGDVYEHLCRSVAFTQANMGAHDLPLMLHADWNDAMNKVGQGGVGESVWTAMQLGVVLPKLAQMAALRGDDETRKVALEFVEALTQAVNGVGWDGGWYRRAFMDDGRALGTHDARQAQIFLNTQTWSVYSGMGSDERQRLSMDAVSQYLDSPLGIKKVHPPVTDYPTPQDPLFAYLPGLGENASIFCHANAWAIIAECLLKRPDRAWKYYHQLIPHVAMQQAGIERYMGEPYVYASNLFGPDSERFGLANVTWLTGTAAWMYLAVTEYILGIRPEWEGLRIEPCIPTDWAGFKATRLFRGCSYNVEVHGGGATIKEMKVDGSNLDGTLIPHVDGRKACTVQVRM